MPNSTVPAAAGGLPSNIIPFPMRRPVGDFEPDRKQFESAYMALCVSWQFADLDATAMDLAIAEMVQMNHHGAMRMVRENAGAISCLYDATDFLIEADNRMQASLWRVLSQMEARR